ncbi:MAG TPA: peptide chain release factor 3 [Anaerolineales bacterium]
MTLKTASPTLERLHPLYRRRTFAIISHPDAGKTTLTEKLLLYAGAIDLAGSVRARRNKRATVSDWMEIEKKRGISISSSVLQFDFGGYVINLLDTPGHQDFSEDTYRTLAAVDSAVMVLDAAKGVEPQTRKLFEVCRLRGIPIFTFINKMDRPARDPIALLDEIQEVLGMQPVPMNWPIGDGVLFQGIVDRLTQQVHLFTRTEGNERKALETQLSLADYLALDEHPALADKLEQDLELLDGLGIHLDGQDVMQERQTPVFFGSALTNFGVELFLQKFLELSPPPQAYKSDEEEVSPLEDGFSGFVFKIQANMDPKHRDSVAFLRVCSGAFERGMSVTHAPSGRELRFPRTYKTFARERETVDTALPGDILALPSNGQFSIGDTFYVGRRVQYERIPRFEAEHFAVLLNKDVQKNKQFDKGLRQLETEGAIQVLYNENTSRREPIIAAVGLLQFEVVLARLENEYGVRAQLEPLPHELARWLQIGEGVSMQALARQDTILARDTKDQYVMLFKHKFMLDLVQERFPSIKFSKISAA